MKTKIGIVILAVISAGLLIALLATQKQAATQKAEAVAAISDFSNQLTTANSSLIELRQVNLMLTNDIATSREQAAGLSNSLTLAVATLTDTKATLQNAESQITNLTSRINDLENQNQLLDQRANALSNTIAGLNIAIAETQTKLVTSETNNAFLTAELQKQMDAKAELERQFNDLDTVRGQVKKLKTEAVASRRLQWIRAGTDPATGLKGAQQMTAPRAASAQTDAAQTNHYDLNVEVGSDGSVRVIPPLTNAPTK